MAPSKVEKAKKKDKEKRLTTAPSFWTGGLKTGDLTPNNDEEIQKMMKNSNNKKKAVPATPNAPSSSNPQPSSSNNRHQVKNGNPTPLPATKTPSASARPSPYKTDDASSSNSDKSKRMTTYNSFWTKSLFGTPKEPPKFVMVSSSQPQASSSASASPSSWQPKGKQAAGSALQSAPVLVQPSQPQASSASASPSWQPNKPQASSANASSSSWHSKGKQAAGPAPHSAPLLAPGDNRAVVPEVTRPGPPQHSASDRGPITNVSHQNAALRRNDGAGNGTSDGRGRADRLVPECHGPDARPHPPSPLRQNPTVPSSQSALAASSKPPTNGADRGIRAEEKVGAAPSDGTNNHKSKGSFFNFGRQHTRDVDPRTPKGAGAQEAAARTGQDRVAPPRPPRDGNEWNQSRSAAEGSSRRPVTELPSSSGRKGMATSERTQPLPGSEAVEIRTAEPLRIVKMKDVRESTIPSGTTPDERNRPSRADKGKQPVSLESTPKTKNDENHQSQKNARGQLQSASQHGQNKEMSGRPRGDGLSLGRDRAPNPSEMAAFATQPSKSYVAGEQSSAGTKYMSDPKTGYLVPVPASHPSISAPPPQQTRQDKKDHHEQKTNGFFSAFHIRHNDSQDAASRQQDSTRRDVTTSNPRLDDRKAERMPFLPADERARTVLSASQQHQRPSRSLDETKNFSAGTSKNPILADLRQYEVAKHQRSTSATSPSEYRGKDFSGSLQPRDVLSKQTVADRAMSPHPTQKLDEVSHARPDVRYRPQGAHHRDVSRSERNPVKPEAVSSRDTGYKNTPPLLTERQISLGDNPIREAMSGPTRPEGTGSRRVEVAQGRDQGRDRPPHQVSQEQANISGSMRLEMAQHQPDRGQEVRGKRLHDTPPTRHIEATTPANGGQPSRDPLPSAKKVQKERDLGGKGSVGSQALGSEPSQMSDRRKPSVSPSSDPSRGANEPVANATEKSRRPRVEQLLQATERSPAVQVSMAASENDNSVSEMIPRRQKDKLGSREPDAVRDLKGQSLDSPDRTPVVSRPKAESSSRPNWKPSSGGEPGITPKNEDRTIEFVVQPARDERSDARKPAPLPREEPRRKQERSSSAANTPAAGPNPSTQPQPTIVVSDADLDRTNAHRLNKTQPVQDADKSKDSFSVDGVTFEEVSLSQHRRKDQEKRQESSSLESKPTEAQRIKTVAADSLSFRERSLRQPSGEDDFGASLKQKIGGANSSGSQDSSSYQPRPPTSAGTGDSRRKDKALDSSSRASKDEARPGLGSPPVRTHQDRLSSERSHTLDVRPHQTTATDEDSWPRMRTTAQAGRGKFVERWSINDEVNVDDLEGQNPTASAKPTADTTNAEAKGGIRDWLHWGKKGKQVDFPVPQKPEKSAHSEKNIFPDARPPLAGRTESAPVLGQDSSTPHRIRPQRDQHSRAQAPLSSESRKGGEVNPRKNSSLGDDETQPMSQPVKDSEGSRVLHHSTSQETNEIVTATLSGPRGPGGEAKPREELSPIPSQEEFVNRMAQNIDFRLAQASDWPTADLSEAVDVKSRRKSRNRNFSVHGSQSGLSIPTVPAIPSERGQRIPSTTIETNAPSESSTHQNINVRSDVREGLRGKLPREPISLPGSKQTTEAPQRKVLASPDQNLSNFSRGGPPADTPQRVQFATVNPQDSVAEEQRIGIRTPIKLADSLVPGSPANFEDLPSDMNRKSQMVAPLALASTNIKDNKEHLQPPPVLEPTLSTKSARSEPTARPRSIDNLSSAERHHEFPSGRGVGLKFISDRPEDSPIPHRDATLEVSRTRDVTQPQSLQRVELPNFDHKFAIKEATLSSRNDNVPIQEPAQVSEDVQSEAPPQLAVKALPTPRSPFDVAEINSQKDDGFPRASRSPFCADNEKPQVGRRVTPKKNVEPIIGADSTDASESRFQKLGISQPLSRDSSDGEAANITVERASTSSGSDKESRFPQLLRDLKTRNVAEKDDMTESTRRDKIFKKNLPDDFDSTFSSVVDQAFTVKGERDDSNNDARGLPEYSKLLTSTEMKRPEPTKDRVLDGDSKRTSLAPTLSLATPRIAGDDGTELSKAYSSKKVAGLPAKPPLEMHPMFADQPQHTEAIPVVLGLHIANTPDLHPYSKSLEEPPPPSYQDATRGDERASVHYTDVKCTPSIIGGEAAGSSRSQLRGAPSVLPGPVRNTDLDVPLLLEGLTTAQNGASLSKPRLADAKTTEDGLVSTSLNTYKDDRSQAKPQTRFSVSESLGSFHGESATQPSHSRGQEGDQISSWLSRLEPSHPETPPRDSSEAEASKHPLDRVLPDNQATLYGDCYQSSSADQLESVRPTHPSTIQRRQSVSSTVPMFVESSGHIVSDDTPDNDSGKHLDLSSSPTATRVGAVSSKKDTQDHPAISTWLEQIASQPFYDRNSVALGHEQDTSVEERPPDNRTLNPKSSVRSPSFHDGTVVPPPKLSDAATDDTVEESEQVQPNPGSFKHRLRRMFGKSEHGELPGQSDRAQPAPASQSDAHAPEAFTERGVSPQDEPYHNDFSRTPQPDQHESEPQVPSADRVGNHEYRNKISSETQALCSRLKEPSENEDDADSDSYEMNIPRKTTSPPSQTEVYSEAQSLYDTDHRATETKPREMSFVPDMEGLGESTASTILDDYLSSDSRRESLAHETSKSPATTSSASERLRETAEHSGIRINGGRDVAVDTPTLRSSHASRGSVHGVIRSTDEDQESVIGMDTPHMTSDPSIQPSSSSITGQELDAVSSGHGHYDARTSASSPQADTPASGAHGLDALTANAEAEPFYSDEDASASLRGTSEPPPAYRDNSPITAIREVKATTSGGDSIVASRHDTEAVQEDSKAEIVLPVDSHSIGGDIHEEVLGGRSPFHDEEHVPPEQATSHHGIKDDDLGHSDAETEFEESVCSDYVEGHNQDGDQDGDQDRSTSDALKADCSNLCKIQDDVQDQYVAQDDEFDRDNVQDKAVDSQGDGSIPAAHLVVVDDAAPERTTRYAENDAGEDVMDEHLGGAGDGGISEHPAGEEAPVVGEAVLEETSVTEAPMEETPVAEQNVEEAPTQEAPVQEEPAQEAPAQEAPVQEEPVQEEPVQEEPVQEEPVQEVPVEEAAAEPTVAETPVIEECVEAPAEETPAAEAFVEEVPEELPVEGAQVTEAPMEEAPVAEAPIQEEPHVEEAPVEGAAAEEEPAQQAPAVEPPVTEEPLEEAPLGEEEPLEEAPLEEAPLEEAPLEEAPLEEAPLEEAPLEEAPLEEAPSEHATVEEASVQETPVEECPLSGDKMEAEGDVNLDNFDQQPASDEEPFLDDQPLADAEQIEDNEREVLVTDGDMHGASEAELGGEPENVSQEAEMISEGSQDVVEDETGDEDALEMNEAFRVEEHNDENAGVEGDCGEGECDAGEPSEDAPNEEGLGRDDESPGQDGPQEDEDLLGAALEDEEDEGHAENEQECEDNEGEYEDDEQEDDIQESEHDGSENLSEEDAQDVDGEGAEESLQDPLDSEDEQMEEEDEMSTVEDDSEFDLDDYEEMPFDDAGFADESHQQDADRNLGGTAEDAAGSVDAANGVTEAGEGHELDLDQLYTADISSIPPSPTNPEFDQGGFDSTSGAGPSTIAHTAQAEGQQQSVSIPASSQQPAAQEGDEEDPRPPVRFSHLYRQSVDWEQALDLAMLRELKEAISKDCEEPTPVGDEDPETVSEPAKEEKSDTSHMLSIDQEQATSVAASPLSPRPLATPPPDWGSPATQVPGDHHSDLATSSRAQITPPPDLDLNRDIQDDTVDHADHRVDREGYLDANELGLKGPQTFEDMGLPQRPSSLLASPVHQEDHGEGPSVILGASHGRSLSQRFSGWWSNAGGAGQQRSDSPPPPIPYDNRYGEDGSAWI